MGGKQPAISVIPNSIDVNEYDYESESTNTNDVDVEFDLVFVGKMDYRPNVDAVLWFAEKVWPLIAASREACTWAIVGQKPHSGQGDHVGSDRSSERGGLAGKAA